MPSCWLPAGRTAASGRIQASREPDDLKAFDEAFVEEFAKAAGSARKGAA
ncbi:hypothetical protein ABZ370_27330 [Streptomyces sp. NPDC005962]